MLGHNLHRQPPGSGAHPGSHQAIIEWVTCTALGAICSWILLMFQWLVVTQQLTPPDGLSQAFSRVEHYFGYAPRTWWPAAVGA